MHISKNDFPNPGGGGSGVPQATPRKKRRVLLWVLLAIALSPMIVVSCFLTWLYFTQVDVVSYRYHTHTCGPTAGCVDIERHRTEFFPTAK